MVVKQQCRCLLVIYALLGLATLWSAEWKCHDGCEKWTALHLYCMKVTVAGFGMGYIARLASALRVAQAGLQNDGHQNN